MYMVWVYGVGIQCGYMVWIYSVDNMYKYCGYIPWVHTEKIFSNNIDKIGVIINNIDHD